MNYREALDLATRYMEILRPASDRIEIVGSVKRADKLECHDIEILLIPKPGYPRPEFGCKTIYKSHLESILARLQATGKLREPLKKANGPKYKKFAIVEYSQLNDFCLDLFIVNPETWGIQNVIRTGPSLFSHSFVTNQNLTFTDHETGRRYKGLLPNEYQYIRGETKILLGENVLSLPEERDAISLLGYGWIEPRERRKYIRPV